MSKSADDALEAGVRIKALPLGHCDATLVVLLSRTRTFERYSAYQRSQLEQAYQRSRFISYEQKDQLARSLGLSKNQIQFWFQNRRSKEKKLLQKHNTFQKEQLTKAFVCNAYPDTAQQRTLAFRLGLTTEQVKVLFSCALHASTEELAYILSLHPLQLWSQAHLAHFLTHMAKPRKRCNASEEQARQARRAEQSRQRFATARELQRMQDPDFHAREDLSTT
ncbi:putative caudal type homeobox protein [Ixodes scapularis]